MTESRVPDLRAHLDAIRADVAALDQPGALPPGTRIPRSKAPDLSPGDGASNAAPGGVRSGQGQAPHPIQLVLLRCADGRTFVYADAPVEVIEIDARTKLSTSVRKRLDVCVRDGLASAMIGDGPQVIDGGTQ